MKEKKISKVEAMVKGIESLPLEGKKEVEAVLRESEKERGVGEKKKGERKVKVMRIGDACRLLGVAPDTLRRWEREGLIHFERTVLGDRIFREEMIPQIKQIIKQRARGRKTG